MKTISIDHIISIGSTKITINPKQLECTICYCIVSNPVQCQNRKCNKTFCSECINQSNNLTLNKVCPFCRATDKLALSDSSVYTTLSNIVIYCPSQSCKEKFTIKDYEIHMTDRKCMKSVCFSCKIDRKPMFKCGVCFKVYCFIGKNGEFSFEVEVICGVRLSCSSCRMMMCGNCLPSQYKTSLLYRNTSISSVYNSILCGYCDRKCGICNKNDAFTVCNLCNKYICSSDYLLFRYNNKDLHICKDFFYKKCVFEKFFICKKSVLLKNTTEINENIQQNPKKSNKITENSEISINNKDFMNGIEYILKSNYDNVYKCLCKPTCNTKSTPSLQSNSSQCYICRSITNINNICIYCKQSICLSTCSFKCKSCKENICLDTNASLSKCFNNCICCKESICNACLYKSSCKDCDSYRLCLTCVIDSDTLRKCSSCSSLICLSCWKVCGYCKSINCKDHSEQCVSCEESCCRLHSFTCNLCNSSHKYKSVCKVKCTYKCSFCDNVSGVTCDKSKHSYVYPLVCNHNVCQECIRSCKKCKKDIDSRLLSCPQCVSGYYFHYCRYCNNDLCNICSKYCHDCEETYCPDCKCSVCSNKLSTGCGGCFYKGKVLKCKRCSKKMEICSECRKIGVCGEKCFFQLKMKKSHVCDMFICKDCGEGKVEEKAEEKVFKINEKINKINTTSKIGLEGLTVKNHVKNSNYISNKLIVSSNSIKNDEKIKEKTQKKDENGKGKGIISKVDEKNKKAKRKSNNCLII